MNVKRKNYQQPEVKVVNLEDANIICQSPTGQNESYGEGNTEGWYE